MNSTRLLDLKEDTEIAEPIISSSVLNREMYGVPFQAASFGYLQLTKETFVSPQSHERFEMVHAFNRKYYPNHIQ
jgi:hypothetical protein